MLRERAKVVNAINRVFDLLFTAAAFFFAYLSKLYLLPENYRGLKQHDYVLLLLLILIIWYVALRSQGVYRSSRFKFLRTILWQYFKAVSIGMLVLFMAMYALKIEDISRILLGLFYVYNLSLLFVAKALIITLERRFRSQGYNSRNMLIVGSGKSAQEVISSVTQEPWAGYRIIGCLDKSKSRMNQTVAGDVRVIGTFDDVEHIFFNEVVDELVLATDLNQIPDIIKYFELSDEMGITVRVLPQWNIRRLGIHPKVGKLTYETLLGVPTLGVASTPEGRGEMVFKVILEYMVAIAGMIVTLPIWIVAALGIKIVSPDGPVLYKQTRVGQNGREFTLYKFRTMLPDADKRFKQYEALNECDGPVFKIKRDPRILPVIGPMLRKSGLDEEPQLLNVLKGELSIVGPRPPLPREVECYHYWQRRRLSIKPGITCFWQVQPRRNEISFEEWMRMDLAYIDNWSLWLDLKIMFRTAWVMLSGAGR